MKRLFANLAVLLVLAGCSNSSGPSGGAGGTPATGTKEGVTSATYKIAVIPKGTTHEFWKSVHFGAEEAAKELGNVEILWKGPLQENDREGQIAVVQDFITKKVSGICLAPLDSQALVPSVSQSKEAGIPVVIFDSGLDDETNIVSYVATDNRNGGVLAAKQMGAALGGKGSVIMLRYNAGSESTHQREDGFIEALKMDFPEIKILSSDEYAGTTPESSLEKAVQVLTKHKDEVTGIFAVCEPNAAGVLKALKELGLVGKVKFIAFDPNQELVAGLSDDSVHGIVLQDPVKMGYLAVQSIVKQLKAEADIKKRVPTGEYVATPENRDTDEMKKLLAPPQFKD